MALRKPGEQRIAPAIAAQAVQWLVELQGGTPSRQRQDAWQRWRAADPEHERAWQRIESVNQGLRGLNTPSALAALDAPSSRSRRDALKLLTLLVIAGGGALAVRESDPLLALRADQSTAVGERRKLTLADGSTLSLNTDSALDIRFDARQRLLHLRQGEMLVEAVEEARPLRVETPQGLILLHGGRLAVRLQERRSQVSLFTGEAQVFSHGQRLALQPGQRLNLDARGSGATQVADENSVAWINGMLVASSMRLGDFLAELGRYRHGRIGCDPAIADLRLSGTYPLDHTDSILAMLPRTLPVEVRSVTRYWISVHPRAAS
ncbi:FecR domain-containing protein [Pseudomonas solani]|uniref:FecR domain-containing protein n=1 Tax=Pseudomonas solani TaxID=2731552 RepID=UPI003C2FEDD8